MFTGVLLMTHDSVVLDISEYEERCNVHCMSQEKWTTERNRVLLTKQHEADPGAPLTFL